IIQAPTHALRYSSASACFWRPMTMRNASSMIYLSPAAPNAPSRKRLALDRDSALPPTRYNGRRVAWQEARPRGSKREMSDPIDGDLGCEISAVDERSSVAASESQSQPGASSSPLAGGPQTDAVPLRRTPDATRLRRLLTSAATTCLVVALAVAVILAGLPG